MRLITDIDMPLAWHKLAAEVAAEIAAGKHEPLFRMNGRDVYTFGWKIGDRSMDMALTVNRRSIRVRAAWRDRA